jgi:hypothetical protein
LHGVTDTFLERGDGVEAMQGEVKSLATPQRHAVIEVASRSMDPDRLIIAWAEEYTAT